MENQWQLVESAYQKWARGRDLWLGSGLSLDKPTVKNAIALTLLESQGRYLGYEEVNRILCDKGIVRNQEELESSSGIPVATLRVAISDLSKHLEKKKHFYQLRSERTGKTVQFALVDRNRSVERGHDLFRNTDEPLIEPRDITRRLVRDGGGLPFASLYSCSRAAAHWLCFSGGTGTSKRKYEAEAFDAYQLDKELGIRGYNGDIGFVSLGPGEGLGEVELLERLLRATDLPRPRRIHYAAIDTSDFLLTAHSHMIRERFSQEIAEGRLTYAPLVGNLYQLERCLSEIRCKLGNTFLNQMPILCTYFGNCLGNFENHEWDFFRSVTDAFSDNPLSILVGVSLLRRKGERPNGQPIEENYTLDSFLLETPRHLMYDLKLLYSEDKKGKPIKLNANLEFQGAGKQPIPSHPYDTADGIRGSVYRFYYELMHDLVTWDGKQRLPSGSKLLLYSIVKYDLTSLQTFLETRGFRVSAPPDAYHIHRIVDGDEEFRYAVFAANFGRKV